jgi:hypothetical protein
MCEKSKTMKHEHGKSQQVQTSQCLCPTIVISGQATKTRHRRERALHDPSAGQQDEASFGFWQAHDFQPHALHFRCLGRGFARVALINKGEFDGLCCKNEGAMVNSSLFGA